MFKSKKVAKTITREIVKSNCKIWKENKPDGLQINLKISEIERRKSKWKQK